MLLDKGCSKTLTLVRGDLVPESKWLDGAVAIHCAHGDTVEYVTTSYSVGG